MRAIRAHPVRVGRTIVVRVTIVVDVTHVRRCSLATLTYSINLNKASFLILSFIER
jgi:hypothetical protein